MGRRWLIASMLVVAIASLACGSSISDQDAGATVEAITKSQNQCDSTWQTYDDPAGKFSV